MKEFRNHYIESVVASQYLISHFVVQQQVTGFISPRTQTFQSRESAFIEGGSVILQESFIRDYSNLNRNSEGHSTHLKIKRVGQVCVVFKEKLTVVCSSLHLCSRDPKIT